MTLLIATGMAVDQDAAIFAIANREAGLLVIVGGAAGDPGAAGPAAAKRPGERLRVHDAISLVRPGEERWPLRPAITAMYS